MNIKIKYKLFTGVQIALFLCYLFLAPLVHSHELEHSRDINKKVVHVHLPFSSDKTGENTPDFHDNSHIITESLQQFYAQSSFEWKNTVIQSFVLFHIHISKVNSRILGNTYSVYSFFPEPSLVKYALSASNLSPPVC